MARRKIKRGELIRVTAWDHTQGPAGENREALKVWWIGYYSGYVGTGRKRSIRLQYCGVDSFPDNNEYATILVSAILSIEVIGLT